MNLLHHAVQVDAGFLVHCHDAGTAVAHLGNELLGLDNHQVDVKRLLAQTLNMFDDGETERDVRHEHAVHHVEVQQVGLAAVDHVNVFGQVAKVGRQQGGRYLCHDAILFVVNIFG